jgi:hypothetical protein
MVSKKIVAIVAVAAVAIALVLGAGLIKPAAAPSAATSIPSTTQPATSGAGTAATPDEASVLSTQTDALLAEQLLEIDVDASEFAASMQDDMALDSSQFLYQ